MQGRNDNNHKDNLTNHVEDLRRRRAQAVERRDAEDKTIRDIDEVFARIEQLAQGGEPAPATPASGPAPPTQKPVRRAKAEVGRKGLGVREDGNPAKTLRVLRDNPGRSLKCAQIIDVIEPGVTGKRRKKLDELVRSTLTKAIRDPETGVKNVAYGRYQWDDPTPEAAPTNGAKEAPA